MVAKGQFITLEGIEGVGKSTHIQMLAEWLRVRGLDVVATREPGGTALGEAVRALLLDKDLPPMSAQAELLLIFAARMEHLDKVIRPALTAARWVVCDRFSAASYAYQGGGRGIDAARIAVLEDWVQGDLRPDMTLLFDIGVEQGLARARAQQPADRFEQEDLAFFERVRQRYRELAAADTEHWRVIDASQSLSAVRDQIEKTVEAFFEAGADD